MPTSVVFPGLWTGFPQWLSGKESAFNAGDTDWVQSPSGRFPWRRKWQPTPVFLPGKSHRQRSLVGYSPRGPKEFSLFSQLLWSTSHLLDIPAGPVVKTLRFHRQDRGLDP